MTFGCDSVGIPAHFFAIYEYVLVATRLLERACGMIAADDIREKFKNGG